MGVHSCYNVFGKFAAITGPFLMVPASRLSGDSRWGVLSLLPLFMLGGYFLSKVREENAIAGQGGTELSFGPKMPTEHD